MKFRLEIDCDGAAFEESEGAEIARILRHVAERVAGGLPRPTMRGCRDINGNHCCAFSLTDTDAQECEFWPAGAA